MIRVLVFASVATVPRPQGLDALADWPTTGAGGAAVGAGVVPPLPEVLAQAAISWRIVSASSVAFA